MEESELMAYRGGNLSNELLLGPNWVRNNQLLFEVKLVGERAA